MTSSRPTPQGPPALQDAPHHPSDGTPRDQLHAERAYHDRCRAALTAMADGADEHVVTGEDVSASGADAEILGRRLRSRAKALRELPEGPLFFGRLDFGKSDDGAGTGGPGRGRLAPGEHPGRAGHGALTPPVPGPSHPELPDHPLHIGRLRITDEPTAPPLVVDWRAPVSRAFYRASAADPQGVAVRRRFGWAPGSRGDSADLTGLEDEHLGGGPDGPAGTAHTRDARDRKDGRGAWTEPDGQGVRDTRDAHADKDAPDAESVADAPDAEGVAGPAVAAVPASGIVAREIERPRVGPMRDIAATIQPDQDDLVRGDHTVSVCVQGAPGTGKTAVGLHRAAYLLYTHPQRVRRSGLLILGPNRTFLAYISEVLPSLGETGVRQATLLEEIGLHPVTATDPDRTAAVKHDPRMAEVLSRALYARVSTEPGGPLDVPDGTYRWRIPPGELAAIVADVRAEQLPYGVGRERVRSRVVRDVQLRAERRAGPRPASWVRRIERARVLTAYLDAVWPKVRPEELLAGLLTDRDALARAAEGLLDADEQETLHWTRPPRSHRSARWSAADLVLLDEIAGLIERPRGYGHIVVDEAQDLSPMECRAIARRVTFGSLTVLGDLAQGTTPWAARDWNVPLRHLGRPDAAVVPLTTGFRVPAEVVALTNRLLARLDVDVPAARSMRGDGELRVRRADDVPGAVVVAVREALTREGSVGVVAADADTDRVRQALTEAGIETAGPGDLDARVAVVPATSAKGLEYDHVVAVEPAAVAESEDRGLHRLYVVLTRAVSRLDVIHNRPLPF